MNGWCRTTMLGSAVASLLWGAGVAPMQAEEDYWRNHWSWYNDTYGPYYQRRYYGTSIGGGSFHAPRYYGRDGVPVYDYMPWRPYSVRSNRPENSAAIIYGWR